MFYVTKLDEELTSSGGSRDPLGLQPVWSYFGRKLIPSLTTVSTRSEHFSRLLIALYCRDRWLEQRPDTELRGSEPLLIFEELHAYSLRAESGDIGETPGKRRVEANWTEDDKNPAIGHWPDQQILRNQAGVGVSGRYFTPLVRMGIVDKAGRLAGDVPVETLFGAQVVELQKAVARIMVAIEETAQPQPFSEFPRKAQQQVTALLPRQGHTTSKEIEFWQERIGITGAKHPLVRRCAHHLSDLPGDASAPARTIVERLLAEDLDSVRRQVVQDIWDCEAYIAPLQKLYDELYNSNGLAGFEDAPQAHAWREQLKRARAAFARLRVEGQELTHRFRSLTEIDVDGSTEAFARTLLSHHEEVAKAKGGTPWIAMEGTRVQALNAAYVPWSWREMEEAAWVNGYYLGSLSSVLRGLEQGVQ